METVLRSASREVVIGPQQPFCIIGERINPTGRKIFQEQLRRGDLSRIVEIDVRHRTPAQGVRDVHRVHSSADAMAQEFANRVLAHIGLPQPDAYKWKGK